MHVCIFIKIILKISASTRCLKQPEPRLVKHFTLKPICLENESVGTQLIK